MELNENRNSGDKLQVHTRKVRDAPPATHHLCSKGSVCLGGGDMPVLGLWL